MQDEVSVQATVEKAEDSGACGIIFPTIDVMHWFASKGLVRVIVTINGYSYRSALSPLGGCHVLPVDADVRAGAHVVAGDRVTVVLRRDTAVTTGEVAADSASAIS